MNVTLKKNRLKGVFQQLINYFISENQLLKEKDDEDMPDNISLETWDSIDNIVSINIIDIELERNEYVGAKVIFNLKADIVYDRLWSIDTDDLLYDISLYIHRSTGLSINLIENSQTNINKREW